MNAHTPRPWWISHSSLPGKPIRIDAFLHGVDPMTGRDSREPITIATLTHTAVLPSDANARLIIAAPELLECSSWVCRLFGTDSPQGQAELQEAVTKLRAAIAFARREDTGR